MYVFEYLIYHAKPYGIATRYVVPKHFINASTTVGGNAAVATAGIQGSAAAAAAAGAASSGAVSAAATAGGTAGHAPSVAGKVPTGGADGKKVSLAAVKSAASKLAAIKNKVKTSRAAVDIIAKGEKKHKDEKSHQNR